MVRRRASRPSRSRCCPTPITRASCGSSARTSTATSTASGSLPIVAVDEPLYRRLPAFLIATVDKFASLPWVGPSGALLGGADRYDAHGFYGAAEPSSGTPLSRPLPPPDLVIQDELHLISGPLGTMAGLYEAAIDGLCQRAARRRASRPPKIVASTATVRRAQDQIQALFGAVADADLPAARARPPRLVLRRDRARVEGPGAALRRRRRPGPQPEGGDAQGVACADGRGRASPTGTPAGTRTRTTRPTRT